MIRKIIKIDQEKCNGCELCVNACHEGAIAMVDGKAKLIRDDYCDGLGNCLPVCPTGAITFEEREALAYDEEAVQKHIAEKKAFEQDKKSADFSMHGGCPGSRARQFRKEQQEENALPTAIPQSRLGQWPVQIQLVPVHAPYFNNANLLVAADCAAFAYGDFHNRFMKNKVTIIGCPKLDDTDYSVKLTEIIKRNNIKSVTVVRMEVPCCGGIENAVKQALQNSGKFIPWQVVTLSIDGKILDE